MKFKTTRMLTNMIHEANKQGMTVTKIKLGDLTFGRLKKDNWRLEETIKIRFSDKTFMGIPVEVDDNVKDMVSLEMEEGFFI